MFKKAWDYIDGHKTIIFMTASTVLQQMQNYEIIPDKKGWNFAIGLTMTLGGGSLAHHIKKTIKNEKRRR